jgi:hypothetical protein
MNRSVWLCVAIVLVLAAAAPAAAQERDESRPRPKITRVTPIPPNPAVPPQKPGSDWAALVVFSGTVLGGWWLWRSYSAPRHSRPRIVFVNSDPIPAPAPRARVVDVRDAVTGQILSTSSNVLECSKCHAMYRPESYQYLAVENWSRCVACGGTSFVQRSR